MISTYNTMVQNSASGILRTYLLSTIPTTILKHAFTVMK